MKTYKSNFLRCTVMLLCGCIYLFAFSSCAEEITLREKRNGKNIEMQFRLASAVYDVTTDIENRIGQRKGEAKMDRKIEDPLNDPIAGSEHVVVGLGDDWIAVANLTKDNETITTRAKNSGTSPLTAETKLIIAAFEKDDPTVVFKQAEYVVNPDLSITPTGEGLWLTENDEYRFAAYTYDTPDIPDPANINLAKDLLWGCFPENVGEYHKVTPASYLISMTLEHLLSEVRAKVTVENGTVSAISNVTMAGKPASTVTLNVPTGAFNSVSGNTGHTFDFEQISTPVATITSDPAITWTVDQPKVTIGSITIEDKPYTDILFNFATTTLVAGNSYTLTLRLSRVTYVVSPATINIDEKSHTPAIQTITITPTPANADWKLTSSETWLRLNTDNGPTGTSYIEGTGTQTIYLVADANTGTTTHSAVIYLNDDSSDERVTVTQASPTYVDPCALIFAHNASASRHVTVTSEQAWTASSNETWCTVSPATGINGQTFAVTCDNNAGTAKRIATITVSAGYSSPVTVTVVQLPANIVNDDPPTNLYLYAGAFWRHNQTGERLIRIQHPGGTTADGAWVATVVEGDDWIVLDKVMTTDPNVGWRTDVSPNESLVENGNDTDFDAHHPVSGTATTVCGSLRALGTAGYQAGDETIYFRIGLKSKYSDRPEYSADPDHITTFPARYGVIVLAYRNYGLLQYLFIRQGEDPDYVMRPEDAMTVPAEGINNPVGPGARPAAVKFSPFNLTKAGALNAAVAVRGGVFTTYPTQAGAYWQWANSGTNTRYAWSPVGMLTDWDITTPSGFWNTLSAIHEACPNGYHRANDGSISEYINPGSVSGSEYRQSLWLNPPTGQNSNMDNSVWGYYADGFFDRRQIVESINNAENSTVSYYLSNLFDVRNRDIAYIGRLFFNPTTNRSLFFPAAGYRTTDFVQTGTLVHTWSSTRTGANTSHTTVFRSYDAWIQFGSRIDAAETIRCVKD